MITLALLMFWVSVGLMFHSYVLYPVLLRLLTIGKKENDVCYAKEDEGLPQVFVVFAAYNEEKVIAEKIDSIFNTTYPENKLQVYIGSDNSNDRTNDIVMDYCRKYPNLRFEAFKERNGKSNVLNRLVTKIREDAKDKQDDVLVLTDANVMFTPDTIYELAKHFKNPSIGQVGANILNKGVDRRGISLQEKSYIENENSLKYYEGLNGGSMIGAFGGCYALRSGLWTEIPPNQLMEDFYLSMNVLAQNKSAIHNNKALCVEDVSNEVSEEFKRKARIQAGNFQNLAVYWPLLLRFNTVSFTFFSHKVIRWLGPLFIFLAFLSNGWLLYLGEFYVFTFLLQWFLVLSPLFDYLLRSIGVHLIVLRFASYFYLMNLALVMGFVKFASGIKTSAWSPTKRNV